MDYLDQMKDHLIMTQKWLVLGGGIFLLTLFGAIIYNKICKCKRSLELINDLIIELQYNIIELQCIKSSTAYSLRDETWRLISGINLNIPNDLLNRLRDVYMKIRSTKDGQRIIQKVPVELDLIPEMVKIEKFLLEIKESIPKIVTDLKSIMMQDTSLPKEYFKRYGMNRKKSPLVCKEYSEHRRKLGLEKALGAGLRRKAAKPA
jgi:hypothetical protein